MRDMAARWLILGTDLMLLWLGLEVRKIARRGRRDP